MLWLLLSLSACRGGHRLYWQGDFVLTGKLPASAALLGPGKRVGAPPPADVGLDDHEADAGEAIIETLVADPRVDFVATWRHGAYELHAARGAIRFTRYRLKDGAVAFAVRVLRGQNPVINQDPTALPTLEEMLRAGTNPNAFWDRSKPRSEYRGAQDPRLRFLSPATATYPYPYSRVAAVFDSPDGPDLAVSYAPFAGERDRSGDYGGLSIADSRGLLALFGAGVRPGEYDGAAQLQDIAPTVARLLGVPPLPDGRLLHGQDGRVLGEMLDGKKARRVLVVNLAGVPLVVFNEFRQKQAERYALLNRAIAEGAVNSGGVIAPFPSTDWPGEYTLITGAAPGRHGTLDNSFFHRALSRPAVMTDHWRQAERFLPPPNIVETIFEAARRAGTGPADQVVSAAIGLFAQRGADYTTVFGLEQTPGPAAGVEPIRDTSTYVCDEDLAAVFRIENALLQHAAALLARENPIETNLVFWSLPAYLAAARRYGPYSHCAALAVQHEMEAVQRVLAALADRRADTAVLLVSDHGMRGVDHTRAGNVLAYLRDQGFAVRLPAQHLLYLPTMNVQREAVWTAPDRKRALLRVTCIDDDTGQPLAGAEASLVLPGGGGQRAVTDAAGRAELDFAPEGREVVFELRHPDYNPRQITLELPAP